MDAGTARRHPFSIFALAVFRVALRIGTELRRTLKSPERPMCTMSPVEVAIFLSVIVVAVTLLA